MRAHARRFAREARRMAADRTHHARIRTAMGQYQAARSQSQSAFHDWPGARRAAARVKREALEALERHLLEFEKNASARGAKIHWAEDAEEARRLILDLVRRKGARRVVKSKVMTSEEIALNAALEANGIEVDETDLGEFIQQLRHESPYHFVFPCMHLSRAEIAETFLRRLGSVTGGNPAELTMVARQHLRRKFLEADVGLTGANFVVADTGMVSITENEGNIRLVASLPPMMITLVGIEKVVPRLANLALFLPMLAMTGTGQPLTGYNSLYGGPRQDGEVDGPEEWHVVLLDNGRTRLLADTETRELLGCIRCGACLNVCPVYGTVGGLAYATTYQGPIGAAITPRLRGLRTWSHLSGASSLCGACTETCPVGIPIHRQLLHNRRDAVRERGTFLEGLIWRLFAWVVNRPLCYAAVRTLARHLERAPAWGRGSRLDPLRAWTATRTLPPIARPTFREYWRHRR